MTPATAPHAAPAAAPTSASNALFLIALGMFLTAAVLPALLAALVRTAVLLALLLIACVATNPSDHSFACWVSEQEDIDLRLKKEKPGVTQWFSAVVKTAIAMVTQEPLTWTYHNAVAFSVVFVPSLNRYAFGCLGYWWWADKHPRLLPLCKAPWLARFTRGGAPSGIEQYMDEDTTEQRRRMSNRVPLPRRATAAGARPPSGGVDDLASAATAFAASMGDLVDSFQSSLAAGGSTGDRASDSATATGSSDRALRANAVKAKINKDWKEASRLFMEASRAALSVMSRTNYVLEAAWCEVEQATTFPTSSSRLAKTVDDVCEELASGGFFDDAARALSEFALRLKRKFPQDAQREAVVHQLASLYVRAKDIAEAGNNTRSALEHAVRAATLFAEAGLWSAAEEAFETVAKLHVRSTHPALANESYGNATLCRIAMLDVAGAEQLSMVYRQRLRSQDVTEQSHIDILIASVFDAYEKGSVMLLEQAMKRFESNQRLQPWQGTRINWQRHDQNKLLVTPMSEDLKRPLFFDVQRVTKAPIALVNRDESTRLKQRHGKQRDDDDSESRAAELPASALPMIRSPRPEKPVYVPSPTKTPAYFRWKPVAPKRNNAARRSSNGATISLTRVGPRMTSPRLSAVVLPSRANGNGWSAQTVDLQQIGPSLFGVGNDNANSTLEMPVLAPLVSPSNFLPSTSGTLPPSRPTTVTVKQPDLFDYEDMPKPATPVVPIPSNEAPREPPQIVEESSVESTPPIHVVSAPAEPPPVCVAPTVESPTPVAVPVTPVATLPALAPPIPTPKLLGSPPSNRLQADDSASDDDEDEGAGERNDEPARVSIEFSGGGGGAARQPQEKAIAQHLLRGKFLRKYLHANNLTRKLKETEQALRSAALMGGVPTMKGGGSLFSRSFIAKSAAATAAGAAVGSPQTPPRTLVEDLLGEEATGLLSDHLPVLRRLSSIDKSINNTAKRIRRMSGIEDPSTPATSATRLPSPPTVSTPKTSERPGSRKFTPLKAIGEKQTAVFPGHKKEEEASGSFDTFEDEFGSGDADPALAGGATMDPSSAHMMRICQHVIAKRAIKAFLRQEISVITIIEVALRDDTHLMPTWLQQSHPFIVNSATMAAHLQQQQASSRASTPDHDGSATPSPHFVEAHRAPIKSMLVEILEAVGGYLKEGDQHLCLEEVYAFALQAERDKLWKRAILLASVCVVLDREFLHGVLLRARCCRRLGLWTQAIKDLAHAILLKPDEYKLVLLRSCLFVKMGDLDSALVDVNRALAFFPKSIDALLLRAEIFHRLDAIGASLQDLTTALLYDPGCWRAFYDRATIRLRAIEGDEYSLNYHWEHMKYDKLLASIIEDYVSAVRKGCQMVEVVETIGDLSVRLMEFTGDANVLQQVVSNLSHLLQILVHDHRRSFHAAANGGASSGLGNNRSPSIANAAATVAAVAAAQAGGAAANGIEQQRSNELARELLVASIHAQRGRLLVLLQDRAGALADFDQAVVTEYHYPVAHFYRGAFATLMASSSSSSTKNEDAAAALAANVQHLNRCISLDPTIAGAYMVRGALFLRDLKFNSALQDFKAAVATDPTLYEVWLQIALIYLNHYHDSDECVRACSSALANDSCLARALYLRAEAFTRQGNLRAALKDYGRLTIAQPDDRWAQLMRGRLLLQMKLAKPALYAFIQFTQLGAHGAATAADKRALILCGRAYKILARFQQAVDQFQRVVSLNPTSENLMLLSESLHSMGDTENSLRVSEKVINADPNSFRGYVRRAQLLVTTGQFQRAMAEYNTALALAPKEARVFYERGVVQMQLYLRWRVAFQVNFEHKPPSTTSGATSPTSTPATKRKRHRSPFEPRLGAMEVEAALGADQINDERTVLQGMKSCFAGAIADFTKCIRLDPLASEPYVDRAELLVLGEEYDRAFQDLATAVERNPKCARAFVNLGVLKCHFAAFAAAIADFDQAIRVDPKLALAFFNRGVCYQKLELFRHADQSYSRCIALSGAGRDVDAHRNRAIARCHTARDRAFEDALADFEQVRQSAPDDDQLHGGLGYVLLQLGRYEDAARCFAAYGRLNRDTFADSGNAYFNLACSGQNTGPATNSTSAAAAAAPEHHLDQAKYDAYLDRALRLYVRAARFHPSNLDLRLNIANCLRRLQQPRRAIAQCDAIQAARPLHHASLESKALCFYEMGRLPEAVEFMNAAIRACVGSSSALQNIFYAFAQTSIHRHALDRKTVGVARDNEASRPTTSAETGESMHEAMSAQLLELRQRRLELATPPTADGASPPKPASAAAPPGVVLTGSSKQLLALYMLNRGVLYEKMGAWEDAARDYKDAAHFDPLAVQPLLSLATLRVLQRRLDESRAALTRVLTLEPANGLAHLNLGVVCLCADETEQALTHFEAAIEALPTCSYAYANKAVALAKRGDLRQAEAQLKRAIEELPSRKEYYLARGKIIAQQKRLQDAMVDFSTALFLGYEGKL